MTRKSVARVKDVTLRLKPWVFCWLVVGILGAVVYVLTTSFFQVSFQARMVMMLVGLFFWAAGGGVAWSYKAIDIETNTK